MPKARGPATTAVVFPFDLFGTPGAGAGAALLGDELREVLADNRRETVPTRAAAYADRLRLREFTFDTLAGYDSWRERGRQAVRKALRSGDFLLVLFNPRQPGTPLADEYLARTGGPRGAVYHAAFRIDRDRLDAHAAALRTRGLDLRGPVDFATGRRSYFLEDPDGHYLELTDR